MTTEVVIGNRQAIALAADSAVTVGKERVWKTANKLFSLGPSNDIGLMMNGSADFLGIAWEVIIKLFREEVQGRRFSTVQECAENFIEFISHGRFRTESAERLSFASIFVEQIEALKSHLAYKTKAEFRDLVVQICDDNVAAAGEHAVRISELSLADFRRAWRPIIDALAKDILGEVITRRVSDAVTRLLHTLATHGVESDYATGLVIAGFGADEMYPCMLSYTVDGCAGPLLRIWEDRTQNLNDEGTRGGYIVPFGQADIVFSFMEGITLESAEFLDELIPDLLKERSADLINHYVPQQERAVESAIQERLNNEAYQTFQEKFSSFRKQAISNPVTKVINSLPKEELADMAQALVELTSLRRKVDSTLETVGGPVDVAVISKGDGFIWLKRKNYFEIESNRDFLYRRYRRPEVQL